MHAIFATRSIARWQFASQDATHDAFAIGGAALATCLCVRAHDEATMSPPVMRCSSNALWRPGGLRPVSHAPHAACVTGGSHIFPAAVWDKPSFCRHSKRAIFGSLIPITMVVVIEDCKGKLSPWL